MSISITTTVPVSNAFLLEILNVAICGACGSWANVTGRVRCEFDPHMYSSARFTSWSDPAISAEIGAHDVAAAVGELLTQPHIANGSVDQRLLGAVVTDDTSAVEMGIADLVIRRALTILAPCGDIRHAVTR